MPFSTWIYFWSSCSFDVCFPSFCVLMFCLQYRFIFTEHFVIAAEQLWRDRGVMGHFLTGLAGCRGIKKPFLFSHKPLVASSLLAEGVGFEPTLGLLLSLISSQVPSTTQPPFLRHAKTAVFRFLNLCLTRRLCSPRLIRKPLLPDSVCGASGFGSTVFLAVAPGSGHNTMKVPPPFLPLCTRL